MKFIKDYSLSIVLVILFSLAWIGQAYFQYEHEKGESENHGHELEMSDFNNSFWASTFENWQSEFLQLFTMVFLTSFLIHKGSEESKDGSDKMQASLDRIEALLKKRK